MKVSIIGQGYVGLTISAFAGASYTVVGFDKNQVIVDQLNNGISHIEGVQNLVIADLISQGNYKATTLGSDIKGCLLYTSPSPRDRTRSRMPSSA